VITDALIARLVAAGITAPITASSQAAVPTGDGPYLSVIETPGFAPTGTHPDGPTKYRSQGFR
jgi:hypothetical protein